MKKIPFEDGVKISDAKVTINDVDYTVTPAQYSGTTPLTAYNLNKLQDNIEDAINNVRLLQGSITQAGMSLSYPSGFNQNNCIPISSAVLTSNGFLFASETYKIKTINLASDQIFLGFPDAAVNNYYLIVLMKLAQN